MFKKTAWIPALLLLTATLTGCNEQPAPHAVLEPQPPAPVVTAPAQPAATAAPAPQPAANAAIADTKAAPGATAKARKAPKAHAIGGELRVKRLVLAEKIAGREPVEAKTTFNAADTDRIYAFVEVENHAEEEGEVIVTFEPPDGGAPRGNVTLTVGASPRWRTWAFTRGARAAGEWTAVVRSPDGQVLARAPFEVTL